MDLSSLINRTSLFPILGMLSGIFLFFLNFNKLFCKQEVKILYYAVSDLDLHCLSMSHKKDPRLIWVNMSV